MQGEECQITHHKDKRWRNAKIVTRPAYIPEDDEDEEDTCCKKMDELGIGAKRTIHTFNNNGCDPVPSDNAGYASGIAPGKSAEIFHDCIGYNYHLKLQER